MALPAVLLSALTCCAYPQKRTWWGQQEDLVLCCGRSNVPHKMAANLESLQLVFLQNAQGPQKLWGDGTMWQAQTCTSIHILEDQVKHVLVKCIKGVKEQVVCMHDGWVAQMGEDTYCQKDIQWLWAHCKSQPVSPQCKTWRKNDCSTILPILVSMAKLCPATGWLGQKWIVENFSAKNGWVRRQHCKGSDIEGKNADTVPKLCLSGR